MKRGLCLVLIGLIVQCCWADDSPNEQCEVEKKFDCGYYGIDEKGCAKERGCCWKESDTGDPWCFQTTVATTGKCEPDQEKKDCGYYGINQKECEERQCCWQKSYVTDDPWCYQKTAASSGEQFLYGYDPSWIPSHPRYRAGQKMRKMTDQLKWERGHNRMNPEVYRRYWKAARKDMMEDTTMKRDPDNCCSNMKRRPITAGRRSMKRRQGDKASVRKW